VVKVHLKVVLSSSGILAVHLLRLQGQHNTIINIAPNFFSFFILAYFFKMTLGYEKRIKFPADLASVVVLCIYEYAQSFSNDVFRFDYLDILATILGYLTIRISRIKI